MSYVLSAAGLAVFVTGLLASFLGNRLRGRLTGLGLMAAGALVVLVSGETADPTTWWMAVTGGLTLAGLLVFGAALGRWTRQQTGADAAVLDDDPG